MRLPVALQLRELGWALAAGLAAGIAYRLLGLFRRGRVGTLLTDGLYCLLLLAGLLAFALWAGRGRLRLFALLAMGTSGSGWLALTGPGLRRLRKGIPGRERPREKEKNFQKNVKN
ncbi:MAG: hypothetical protein IKS05_10390 [Oscillospiraceae bacterium]|nr:hypothetical protein [Oscillospiraceae bacterium]